MARTLHREWSYQHLSHLASSRCSIDALRRNENPIYHSARSRNLLLPPRTLAIRNSEVEIQRGGRGEASVMRNQRVSRGLWQHSGTAWTQLGRYTLKLCGNGRPLRWRARQRGWRSTVQNLMGAVWVAGRVIGLKPERISVTPRDELAVALVGAARKSQRQGKKIYECVSRWLETEPWSWNRLSSFFLAEGEALQWTCMHILILFLSDNLEENKTNILY